MIPLYQLFEDIEDVASAFKSFGGDKEGAALNKNFFKDTNWMPFNDPGARRAEGYAAAMKKVARDKENARIKALEINSDKQFAKGIKSVKDAERDKEIAKLEKYKNEKLADLKAQKKDEPWSYIKNKLKLVGVGAAGLGAGTLIQKQKNEEKNRR